MSTDYDLKRSIQDIQSGISRLDANSRRKPARPGQAIIQRAAAQLARVCGDEALANVMEAKAAVAPAQTTVATWAAELVSTGLPGLILSLERQSAMAAILTKSPQVSVLGVGVTRVPVAGVAPPARVVAEAGVIPVLRGTFAALSLTPFKLAAICPFSDELAEFSTIEAAVRSLLSQSIAAGMDAVAFSTASPGGLLNGVTPIAASAATPSTAAMAADLKALLAALTNPSPDVVFVMAPAQALVASTVLLPGFLYPILTSSALTAGQVVAVDPMGVAAAISAEPQILVSQSAAIHEEDTTPLPLATGAQGSGVVAVPMRAAFQTDVSLMRVIMHCAWAARVGAVSSISAVSW
jgi:hypothetical protein